MVSYFTFSTHILVNDHSIFFLLFTFTTIYEWLCVEKEIVHIDEADHCIFDNENMGLNKYESLVIGTGLDPSDFINEKLLNYRQKSIRDLEPTTLACK